jgi:hypothetical protein
MIPARAAMLLPKTRSSPMAVIAVPKAIDDR